MSTDRPMKGQMHGEMGRWTYRRTDFNLQNKRLIEETYIRNKKMSQPLPVKITRIKTGV